MNENRTQVANSDDLDLLSAIWILSCNDENPIITYEGIKYRLNLPQDFDVKKLIKSRGELFRCNVPPSRIEKWKKTMLDDKHLPSWLRDIEDKTVRKEKIEALAAEDAFRNQFRWQANAPSAPIEIIEWGLQHIDRLREASIATREERIKKLSNIWLPLFSMFVALCALVSSAYLQNNAQNIQIELKKYEVSFKPKQENYSLFMHSLLGAWDSAVSNDHARLVATLDRIEIAYYQLEPFLEPVWRDRIWNQFQQFSGMCHDLRKFQSKPDGKYEEKLKNYLDSFTWYKNYFRQNLYQQLFEK